MHLYYRHIFLFIALMLIPFSNSVIFGSNILSITGAKPFNIMAIIVLLVWVVNKGEFIVFTDKIRFYATVLVFAYFFVFSLSFARTFIDYSVLVDRFPAKISSDRFSFLLSYWLKPCLGLFIFLYIINFFKSTKENDYLVKFLAVTGFVLSLVILYLSIPMIMAGYDRNAIGIIFQNFVGLHYNSIATYLLIMTMISLVLGRNSTLFRVICFFCFMALLATQSRGAILSLLASAAIYLMIEEKRIKRIIVPILSVLLLVFIFKEVLFGLISVGSETGEINEVSSGRIESMWIPLFSEAVSDLSFLLLGNGMFGMVLSNSYVSYHDFYMATHAHNAYINMIVDCGLIVFVAFLLCMYKVTRKLYIVRSEISSDGYIGVLYALLAYFLVCLFGRSLLPNQDAIIVVLMYGVCASYLIAWKNENK